MLDGGVFPVEGTEPDHPTGSVELECGHHHVVSVLDGGDTVGVVHRVTDPSSFLDVILDELVRAEPGEHLGCGDGHRVVRIVHVDTVHYGTRNTRTFSKNRAMVAAETFGQVTRGKRRKFLTKWGFCG